MDRSKSLLNVKLALAEKYERLCRLSSSKSKRKSLAYQALKFRRQAEQLLRPQKPKGQA